MRGNVPIYVGLALVCLFLTPATAGDTKAATALTIGAMLSIAAAAYAGIKSRRDPYDLNLLREVHDREEAESIEVEEPEQYDNVLCPHCHNVYPARFPACPRCGRTPAA